MYERTATLGPMTVARMVSQFTTGSRGSFGILRQNESRPLDLCAAGCAYPVSYLRVSLTDQDGREFHFDKDGFPKDHQFLLDDHGTLPAKARFALLKGQTNVIAFSGEGITICGSVLVVADAPGCQVGVNAAFWEEADGHQESSILWDRSEDMIKHWLLQDRIQGGEIHHASVW